MWSISTLVTPKGDDQMADIQAERIQPPHRRCVVVKKPTVDFQNFLTTEKYLGGWHISTKCSNCTHLFWLKLIALSHYQSLNLWWKVRLSPFKTSETPSKRCYLTCFLDMKIFPMPLIWEIFPMRGLAPVGNISASRWVTLLDGLEILRHFAETTPKLPAHCGTWFDLGTNGRPLIQRHITKPSVRSQGSRQVAKAGGKS